jgi:hypothetical protein
MSSPIMMVSSRCLDSTNILGSFLGHADAAEFNQRTVISPLNRTHSPSIRRTSVEFAPGACVVCGATRRITRHC